MRRLPKPIAGDLVTDCSIRTFNGARSSPEDVLEAVDGLLEAFGLEIVQYRTDRPDQYTIGIERRVEAATDKTER